ncbi:unnamed protein product [Amoebophrya sp. A120]|nr:unnamed protein product [Amoebophrya sp. A120]|eukprot:GSA120T00016267001.1
MFRSRPDTAQAAAKTQQEAKSHASWNAAREDTAVPRSVRKTLNGRAQEAAFRKQMQKAVKSERKAGGFVRGQVLDAEDVAEMAGLAGNETDESDESDHDKNSEADDSSSSEGSCSDNDIKEKINQKPQGRGAKKQDALFFVPFKPVDLGEDEDLFPAKRKKIEQKLVQQLKNWAVDLNLDHAKAVRTMYAAWHPDKQIGKPYHAVCGEIFQTLQAEVRRLQQERERRFAKFEELKKLREEKKSEKHAEKQARREKHEEREILAKMNDNKQSPSCSKIPSQGVRFSDQPPVEHEFYCPAKDSGALHDENEGTSDGDDSDSDSDCPDLVSVPARPSLRPKARSHFSLTSVSTDRAVLFGGESANGEDDKLFFHKDTFHLVQEGDEGAMNSNTNPAVFRDALVDNDNATANTPSSDDTTGPCARSAHQAVRLGGNCSQDVFLFGGEWASADGRRFRQFDDSWVFSAEAKAWCRVLNADSKTSSSSTSSDNSTPAPRSGHRMVFLDNKVYLFGGFTEQKNGNVKYLSDFYGGEVTKIDAPVEDEKKAADGGKNSAKGTKASKNNSSSSASQVQHLPTYTIKWVRDKRMKINKPSARAGFTMWARTEEKSKKKEIYIFGGSQTGAKGDLKKLYDLWCFDVDTLEWREIPVGEQKNFEQAFSVTRELFDSATGGKKGTGSGPAGEGAMSKSAKKRAKKKQKAAGAAEGCNAEEQDEGAGAGEEENTKEPTTEINKSAKDDQPPLVEIERKFIPRSGLSCCKLDEDRVLFFGGVSDILQDQVTKSGLAVFHNDVLLLNLRDFSWTVVWSPYHLVLEQMRKNDMHSSSTSDAGVQHQTESTSANSARKMIPQQLALALRSEQKITDDSGGVDLAKLLFGGNNLPGKTVNAEDHEERDGDNEKNAKSPLLFPRGRMGSQIVVLNNTLYIFGGTYETGPRRECALDDLWALPLEGAGVLSCGIETSDAAASTTASSDHATREELLGASITNNSKSLSWSRVLRFSREQEEDELDEIEQTMEQETAENTLLNSKTINKLMSKKKKKIAAMNKQASTTTTSDPVSTSADRTPASGAFVSTADGIVLTGKNSSSADHGTVVTALPCDPTSLTTPPTTPAYGTTNGTTTPLEEPTTTEKKPNRIVKPTPATVREAQEEAEHCTVVSLKEVTDPSQLSKKEKVKWEKKQRQEVKMVKQMEKEAKKNLKKQAKLEKQKSGGGKKGEAAEEDDEE